MYRHRVSGLKTKNKRTARPNPPSGSAGKRAGTAVVDPCSVHVCSKTHGLTIDTSLRISASDVTKYITKEYSRSKIMK